MGTGRFSHMTNLKCAMILCPAELHAMNLSLSFILEKKSRADCGLVVDLNSNAIFTNLRGVSDCFARARDLRR